MLELNQTLIFQIIAFFVLLYILNRFLYKPVFRVLEERKKRTEGSLKEADAINADVSVGLKDYEKNLKDAVIKAEGERGKILKAAVDKEKELLEKTRLESVGELLKARKELSKTKESTLASLKEETSRLSKTAAEKLLGRAVVLILMAFLPQIANASEGGGGSIEMVWKVINFTVLLVGIYIVWKKFLKGFLEDRTKVIKSAIEGAERIKLEAEEKLKEYKEKVKDLDKKTEEIERVVMFEAEVERDKILKQAEIEAVKIKNEIKFAIEQEIKKAKMEIRKELAELTVERVKEILKREINSSDQVKITKTYIENLRLGR